MKADDAYNINSSLAFIVRVSDYDELLTPETSKELEKYDNWIMAKLPNWIKWDKDKGKYIIIKVIE